MIELENVKTRISAPAHLSATGGRVSGLVVAILIVAPRYYRSDRCVCIGFGVPQCYLYCSFWLHMRVLPLWSWWDLWCWSWRSSLSYSFHGCLLCQKLETLLKAGVKLVHWVLIESLGMVNAYSAKHWATWILSAPYKKNVDNNLSFIENIWWQLLQQISIYITFTINEICWSLKIC